MPKIKDQRAYLMQLGFELRGACSAAKNRTMQIGGVSTDEIGVYAFVVGKQVYYVGSARRGLRERLRHYEITRSIKYEYTSERIRGVVLKELVKGNKVEVLTLIPLPHNWKELRRDSHAD